MKFYFYLNYLFYLLKFNLRRKITDFSYGKIKSNSEIKDHIIKIEKNGYSLIHDFFSKEECISVSKILDEFAFNNKNFLHFNHDYSDLRIFGINNANIDLVKKFYGDNFFQEVGENFLKCKIKNFFTMFGKTIFKLDNIGSGGGWHRDGIQPSYKAMVYLSDVNNSNGPFQIIINSNKFYNVVRAHTFLKNKNLLDTRFTNEEINDLIKNFNYSVQTLSAKAGTVLLFDGSLLHRGSPLFQGKRYALTNYYFPSTNKIDPDHYSPMYK